MKVSQLHVPRGALAQRGGEAVAPCEVAAVHILLVDGQPHELADEAVPATHTRHTLTIMIVTLSMLRPGIRAEEQLVIPSLDNLACGPCNVTVEKATANSGQQQTDAAHQ